MYINSAQYLKKINKKFLAQIDDASGEKLFSVLVTYAGPELDDSLKRKREAREQILEENRKYMARYLSYYREREISHKSLDALCAVNAQLKKEHLYDLLQDDNVVSVVDGTIPLKPVSFK